MMVVQVTPQTLFRGRYEGCDVGPHVSQFLLRDFKLGNQTISQVRGLLLFLPENQGFLPTSLRTLLDIGSMHWCYASLPHI
jgi:hypothetical protein